MSRYIDAEKLIQLKCIEKCGKVADYCQCKCFDLDDIRNFPTADVKPIIDEEWKDLINEIDKLPRIKVGNSNSPTVKYCIDEVLIYELLERYKEKVSGE